MAISLSEQVWYLHTRINASLVFGIIVFSLGYNFMPVPSPRLDTVEKRLIYTLRWLFISTWTLLLGICRISSIRFFSKAADPIGGNSEHLVCVHKQYLQNTLEQLFLHVIGLLTLSSYLTADSMQVIPTLVLIFFFARILFWIGYTISPLSRAYGFALTCGPSICVFVYSLFCFYKSSPMSGLSSE